jgi:hypothetical protein
LCGYTADFFEKPLKRRNSNLVRQTKTNSLTMETKWLEDKIFRDPRQA